MSENIYIWIICWICFEWIQCVRIGKLPEEYTVLTEEETKKLAELLERLAAIHNVIHYDKISNNVIFHEKL